MADDAGEHAVNYEAELTSQLEEQRAALADVEEALRSDPSSDELHEVKAALDAAISELQAALLELKRATLLAALDTVQAGGSGVASPPTTGQLPHNEERQVAESSNLLVGDQCRFPGEDGRWYAGRLLALRSNGLAEIEYLCPTRLYMMDPAIVRLGHVRRARASRTAAQPAPSAVDAGPAYARPEALRAVLASAAAAAEAPGSASPRPSTSTPGSEAVGRRLWQEVHVDAIDELSGVATVVVAASLGASGAQRESHGSRRVVLALDDLVRQPWLDDSDLDTAGGSGGDDDGGGGHAADCPDVNGQISDVDSDGDDGDDGEEGVADDGGDEEGEGGDGVGDVHAGLGLLDVLGHARLAAASGAQTDTAHFADWEAHSRGIASRLMARMGYVMGTGLGTDGRQGSAMPLEVTMLPQRRGLGGAPEASASKHTKKKKRGGERSRRRRHAEAARAAKHDAKDEQAKAERQEGPGAVGLFSFINKQLGDTSEAAAKIKGMERSLMKGVAPPPGGGRFAHLPGAQGGGNARPDDRKALMKQQDRVAACEAKVAHFQAMLSRNSGNATLSRQVSSALAQAQKELRAANSETARMQKAVSGKEAQSKFWTKF